MAITQEEMLRVKEAAKKAEESERPFPVLKDNELTVVGDVNDIDVKPHDYTLTFRFPETMGIEGERLGRYTTRDVEYKGVYIAPKDAISITRELMNIEPFFHKLNDDGTLTERTNEELAHVVEELNDGIVDSMYAIVAKFLKVDKELVPYISPVSCFETVAKIITDHPEAWNEADVFFG